MAKNLSWVTGNYYGLETIVTQYTTLWVFIVFNLNFSSIVKVEPLH